MDMTFLNVLLPMMFEGLKLTILIAVVGITIGFLIGSLCGYLLQSKYKIGKAIAEVYIWIIRATPLMVQALYGYFVIPKLLGVDIGPSPGRDPLSRSYRVSLPSSLTVNHSSA